jgi:signal peptidase I
MRSRSLAIGALAISSQLFHVSGKSMTPTINSKGNGSLLLLDKVSSWFGIYTPKVNDIVVFVKPGFQKKSVVKRVTATCGQSVVTKDGTVVIVERGKHSV